MKGINSESAKIQTPESRSSKLNHARNFLEGVHQCQTNIEQEAGLSGLFAPSYSSFDETIDSASGTACSLCQFPVPSIPLLCSKDIFCCDSAKLKLMLGSRIFTRFLNVPLLRLRTLTLRCPTVHGARQRRLFRALAAFDCRLAVLLWRRLPGGPSLPQALT